MKRADKLCFRFKPSVSPASRPPPKDNTLSVLKETHEMYGKNSKFVNEKMNPKTGSLVLTDKLHTKKVVFFVIVLLNLNIAATVVEPLFKQAGLIIYQSWALITFSLGAPSSILFMYMYNILQYYIKYIIFYNCWIKRNILYYILQHFI